MCAGLSEVKFSYIHFMALIALMGSQLFMPIIKQAWLKVVIKIQYIFCSQFKDFVKMSLNLCCSVLSYSWPLWLKEKIIFAASEFNVSGEFCAASVGHLACQKHWFLCPPYSHSHVCCSMQGIGYMGVSLWTSGDSYMKQIGFYSFKYQ